MQISISSYFLPSNDKLKSLNACVMQDKNILLCSSVLHYI